MGAALTRYGFPTLGSCLGGNVEPMSKGALDQCVEPTHCPNVNMFFGIPFILLDQNLQNCSPVPRLQIKGTPPLLLVSYITPTAYDSRLRTSINPLTVSFGQEGSVGTGLYEEGRKEEVGRTQEEERRVAKGERTSQKSISEKLELGSVCERVATLLGLCCLSE